MKKTVTIHVKKIDIKKGIPASCSRCPIARAVRRRFPKAKDIKVSAYLTMILKNERLHLDLPERANVFIERFDDRVSCKPFSFRLVL